MSATFRFGFVQIVSTARLTHSVHKTLFGSDWLLFTEIYRHQEWVTEIGGLEHPPALRMTGLLEIVHEDKACILGTNAQTVAGLANRVYGSDNGAVSHYPG